jgi:hypothetical protein
MKSYIYIYRESALSSLTQKQQRKARAQQGRFANWRVLHVDSIIPGEFPNNAAVVAIADNNVFQILKSDSDEFLDYDALSGLLEFGNSLALVA